MSSYSKQATMAIHYINAIVAVAKGMRLCLYGIAAANGPTVQPPDDE
jgi:hypothetical protein